MKTANPKLPNRRFPLSYFSLPISLGFGASYLLFLLAGAVLPLPSRRWLCRRSALPPRRRNGRRSAARASSRGRSRPSSIRRCGPSCRPMLRSSTSTSATASRPGNCWPSCRSRSSRPNCARRRPRWPRLRRDPTGRRRHPGRRRRRGHRPGQGRRGRGRQHPGRGRRGAVEVADGPDQPVGGRRCAGPQAGGRDPRRVQAANAAEAESRAKVDSAKAVLAQTQAELAKRRPTGGGPSPVPKRRGRRRATAGAAELHPDPHPYAGVVTERNVVRGDFVQPAGNAMAKPLLAVARTDVVRIFVDVPEMDAASVEAGRPGYVGVPALSRADDGRQSDADRLGPGATARCTPRSTCPIPTAGCGPGCTPRPTSSLRSGETPWCFRGRRSLQRAKRPSVGSHATAGPCGRRSPWGSKSKARSRSSPG